MNALQVRLGVPALLEENGMVQANATQILQDMKRPSGGSWFCACVFLGIKGEIDEEETLLKGSRAIHHSNSALVYFHFPNWTQRDPGYHQLKFPGASNRAGHRRPTDTLSRISEKYFREWPTEAKWEIVPFNKGLEMDHVRYFVIVTGFEGEIRRGLFVEEESVLRKGGALLERERVEIHMEPHLNTFEKLLRGESHGGIFRSHRTALYELVRVLGVLGNPICRGLSASL